MIVGRSLLAGAGCRLGKVRGKRSPTAKVVIQDVKAGSLLPVGFRISVKLAG